jgi:hypothetical protein
MGPKID